MAVQIFLHGYNKYEDRKKNTVQRRKTEELTKEIGTMNG
jgi:hypothetical protein